MSARALLALLVLLATGCVPELDERASAVDTPRILAVVGDPPEAAPGDTVRFTVLVASADGTVVEPFAYWALCFAPKPPGENNAVNSACWDREYRPVGGPAATLDIPIPEDACKRFGPEVESADQRPRDADETGGYYQPIRVSIPELAAFGFERIRCDLPNASADVALEYRERYQNNRNPSDVRLSLSEDGEVRTRSPVLLSASFEPSSVEDFVVYDQSAQELEQARETLRASWFTTAGELDADTTEPQPGEGFATNIWHAPEQAGHVTLWVVLRDSRGGSSFATLELDVGP